MPSKQVGDGRRSPARRRSRARTARPAARSSSRAMGEHLAGDRVHADDLGVGRDVQQRLGRCPGAAAEVQQPQAGAAIAQAHPAGPATAGARDSRGSRRRGGRSCVRVRRTRGPRSRGRSGRARASRGSREASSRILSPSPPVGWGLVVTALVVSDEEDRGGGQACGPNGIELIISAGDLPFDYLADLTDRLGAVPACWCPATTTRTSPDFGSGAWASGSATGCPRRGQGPLASTTPTGGSWTSPGRPVRGPWRLCALPRRTQPVDAARAGQARAGRGAGGPTAEAAATAAPVDAA